MCRDPAWSTSFRKRPVWRTFIPKAGLGAVENRQEEAKKTALNVAVSALNHLTASFVLVLGLRLSRTGAE